MKESNNYFIIFNFLLIFLIEVQLIYNGVLVSVVQKSNLVT